MSYLSRLTSLKNLFCMNKSPNLIIRTYVFKPPELKKTSINVNLNQIRHQSFFKRFQKRSPEKYRIKDNVPPSYELIYRNTMDRYLLAAQVISSFCLIAVGVTVVRISTTIDQNPQISFEAWQTKPKAIENEVFLYLVALATFSVLLQYIVIRCPLRVYNNPRLEKYIFVNYSTVPFAKKSLTCARREISKLPDLGVLPWNQCRYDVKHQPMILVENFFRMPGDLYVMLGEQEYYDD